MIRKLLIANRGEIAARIIRTAKRLGLATVAVYSEADSHALHVHEADEAVCLGPPPAKQSYLNVEAILQAALETRACALHPGYGFLSENADFAAACAAKGLLFVGPPVEAIRTMGNKVAARAAAMAADVPILPGSERLENDEHAVAEANRLGYPVLLKPAGGGGGIGMQRVDNAEQMVKHFNSARDKAARFFGEGALYIEKLVLQPRHIEVQIAADTHGHVVHMQERECSIQRRHQKVIEETPSPAVTPQMRAAITGAAMRLAKQVKYASLGTVEMVLDGEQCYFLEMNTRLQVEHTVTEMVTGLDLVEWQIRIAMGERLPALQSGIEFQGHAIQCRICAENPDKGFLPSPGTITELQLPGGPGVRNDVGVRVGDAITPFYDSMFAKLIVHGASRAVAVDRMSEALATYQVAGVVTNCAMHQRIMENAVYRAGALSTHFLKEQLGLRA